jgi:DNA-binding response OmpR family regulator
VADKTKILIVDDEPINLEFFDVMLTKLGFQVEMAEDGEEALEKIRSGNPDLVILDNIMPKLSGWEVTRIVKNDEEFENHRDVPIIMFSAMDDVKDKVEGFELGVEDYITKPFNFSEVFARIKAVLHSRELSKQVLKKERRLVQIDSLNQSLIYFTEHLENPVLDLLKNAQNINHSDSDDVARFVQLVIKECDEVLATLSGLREEIEELKNQDDSEAVRELSLQDLEEKFQKHFMDWKVKNNN